MAPAMAPRPRGEPVYQSAAASVPEPETGTEFHLRDYWKVLHAQRQVVVSIAVVGVLCALAWNYIETPTYRAAATLQIDREQPSLAQIGQQNFPQFPEQPDYIETQYKVLRSRTLATHVIDKLGLAARAELNHDIPAEELEQLDAPHPHVLERFLDKLSIRPAKGTRLVDVSFESVDRELAPRVVNTLAESFIEHNLQTKWDATQKASVWLQQQLASLKNRLEDSEAALQDYATRHSILFVEERKDITTEKLAQLEGELTRAESDRVEKQSLAMLVEDIVRRGDRMPGSLSSPGYQELLAQRSALRRQYASLLVSYAPGYPAAQRVRNEIDEIELALRAEQDRMLAGVNEGYEVAMKREELLGVQVDGQRRQVTRLSDDFIQYNILKRDAETNRKLYDGLLQRLKEAGISAGLRASNIAILDSASVPQRSYRPMILLNLTVGLALGLIAGVALAFTREHMHTGVRTPEEVERLTNLGLLAVIPRTRKKQERKLLTHRVEGALGEDGLQPHRWEPEQGLSEAYRTLRSSVLLGWDDSMRRILLTSSQPQEGKTTLSLNLACSLAQLGRKVLVIDADMRRPDCARQLGVVPKAGLSEYLQGLAELDDVILQTAIPGLCLIPAGKSTSVASDLLYSPRLAAMLDRVGEQYDHVVIDSPPSLVLSDARTISRLVEGVIMVVSDKTERGSLVRTKQMFDDAGVNFLGFVMNRVNLNHLDYGYYRDYGYYYSYSSQPEESGKSRRSKGKKAA